MNKTSLRANRLANEFEGFAAAHLKSSQRDEHIHEIGVMEGDMPVRHTLTTTMLTEAAKLLRERGEGITLDDEQRRALIAAMNNTPYSAAVSMRARVETVDDVTSWLRALAIVLGAHAAGVRDMEDELRELRSQRDATRAFLGVDRLDVIESDVDELRTELVTGRED